jgi:signal peptidase I
MVTKLGCLVAVALMLTGCDSSPPKHRYQITSVAMAPSLEVGDSIETAPAKQIARGDVVMVRVHEASGTQSRLYRVVGLPGERISVSPDRQVVINDHALAEPYLASGTDTRSLTPTTIGAGGYFVLGDNREHAADSRFFGTVARNDITEVAVKIVLPKRRSGPIPGP